MANQVVHEVKDRPKFAYAGKQSIATLGACAIVTAPLCEIAVLGFPDFLRNALYAAGSLAMAVGVWAMGEERQYELAQQQFEDARRPVVESVDVATVGGHSPIGPQIEVLEV